MLRLRTPVVALGATLALSLAACGGGSDDAAQTPDGLVAEGGAVTIEALDTLKWGTDAIQATPGALEITIACGDAVDHNVVIEETGDEVVAECGAGETATGTTSELAAGTYTFYCSIPGHRSAGMEGTLTVSG